MVYVLIIKILKMDSSLFFKVCCNVPFTLMILNSDTVISSDFIYVANVSTHGYHSVSKEH